MKYNVLVLLVILLININCIQSQNTESDSCNQSVWVKRLAKNLPKEVCIPVDYLISNVYESVDLNRDNQLDFIFKYRNKQLKDGDTLFLSIYNKTSDSTYTYLSTFENLYPIYFKSYDFSYKIPDSTLNALKSLYNSVNPFMSLKFETNTIILKIESEARGGYIFYWVYNKEKNDWLMNKVEFWNQWNEQENTEVEDLDIPVKGQSIDEFNYFDYL